MRGLRDFAKNRDGNFVIYFSVVITMLLAAVGAGVDFAGSVSVKNEMQFALDSAVLAAAAKGGTLDQNFAKDFFMGKRPDDDGEP